MGRELKFRAYIKPLKRYATGIDTIQFHKCCDVAGAGIWTVVTANEGIFEFDDVVIEQYTELKDKNGKEIYDGDIVESKIGKIYEVSIDEGDTRFQSNDGSCGGLSQGYVDEFNMVIIGNIHENKKLLEEK